MNEPKISKEGERLIENLCRSQPYGWISTDCAEARDLRAHIAALESRVAELEAANVWRPIETAPRIDSALLLAYGCHGPYVAYWDEQRDDILSRGGNARIGATHWQPLPPAPAESGSTATL